jgi:hypothetical protein
MPKTNTIAFVKKWLGQNQAQQNLKAYMDMDS